MAIVLSQFSDQRSRYEYTQTVDGTEYLFRFAWYDRAKSWYVDIGLPNGDDPEMIVTGIRVVADFDLLYRHQDPRLFDRYMFVVDVSGEGRDIEAQSELGENGSGRVRISLLTQEEWDAARDTTLDDDDTELSIVIL